MNEQTLKLQHEVESHAEARRKAELASLAKSAFLATMSHEIRTPMTGMLGMLRILRDGRLDAEQRRHLATASGAGEALLGILNSILDYSKIESGKVEPNAEPFRLSDALMGVIDLMRPAAAENGLRLEVVIDEKLAPWLIGDSGKIRQIVFNLVSNAIKFTPHGEVRVDAKVLASDTKVQTIAISVKDTGIGIAPDQLEQVFDPFTQSDVSVTRRYGGTGLGLAISRGIAEALNGRLDVKSVPGRGSTFTLTLTLSKTDAPGHVADEQGAISRPAPRRILVVEDDEATRQIAAHFLGQLGHSVATVKDGHAAFAACAAFAPDIVLMDISLPDMDGITTARRLRESSSRSRLPVIAMSAHVFREEVDHYLASGMDAYVAKPLSPEALSQAIAAVSGAHRTRRRPRVADEGCRATWDRRDAPHLRHCREDPAAAV